MVKYGTLGWYWVSTRYSPSQHPPSHPTPGTPPAAADVQTRMSAWPHTHVRGLNMVVGLKLVGQLTLSAEISETRGITEVYNLRIAGNLNNHFLIPGNE